jgi:hypothetical protein
MSRPITILFLLLAGCASHPPSTPAPATATVPAALMPSANPVALSAPLLIVATPVGIQTNWLAWGPGSDWGNWPNVHVVFDQSSDLNNWQVDVLDVPGTNWQAAIVTTNLTFAVWRAWATNEP